MAFWIMMLVVNWSLSILLICLGGSFIKNPPKKINKVYGYRTTMSMKNTETWRFAHNCCGKLWQKSGKVLFVITPVAMLCVFGRSEDTVGMVSLSLCIVFLLVMCISIVATEKALRRNFDKEGNKVI